ncbi:hypothetical protein GPJ56_003317 [Histomonas meleagridis]|uniref:uncharacterized protein n=1 Tax=Histomonas meleagridis TaxID=135588 RepID=UPI00355A2E50|nr:hypothetical protein GPJ56_003317 [Histomonas meleagridis]KAH0804936.1 hypothetical protein GO595_001881 [Histomonas meleagridis]
MIKNKFEFAIQDDSEALPYNFTYTCLLWIGSGGIFSKFEFQDIISCGTQEGPIVLIGETKDKKLSPVSLICAHTFPITHQNLSINPDYFLSISYDGTVCKHSRLDGNCSYKHQFQIPYGEHRISLYNSNEDYFWIWTIGLGVRLIDLKGSNVIYSVLCPGLNSFLYLSPSSSSFVKEETAAMVTNTHIYTYKQDSNKKLAFINKQSFTEDHNQIVGCKNGIVSFNKHSWFIHKPEDLSILYSGTFDDMDQEDEIRFVEWSSRQLLCFSSLKGDFYVIQLQRKQPLDNDFTTIIQSSLKTGIDNVFAVCAFKGPLKVAISPDLKTIVSSSHEGTFILKPKSTIEKCFWVPNQDTETVYKSDGTNVHLWDLVNQTIIKSIHFDKKITSIYSNSFLILGHEDGSITYFGSNFEVPFNKTAVSSPIISFVKIPSKHEEFIAISKDGSFCVVKDNDSHKTHGSIGFPITSIHYLQSLKIIIIGYSNGIYLTYSFENPNPLQTISSIPKDAIELSNSQSLDSIISTINVSYQSFSFYFQVAKVAELYTNITSNPQNSEQLIEIANRLYNLIVNSSKSQKSLAIIGDDNVPTFFYPPYKISFKYFLDVSPHVGTQHLFAFQLLSEILENDFSLKSKYITSKIIEFFPIITKMAFDKCGFIQKTASAMCVDFCCLIPFQKCQEFVSPYLHLDNISDLAAHEKLLLAMLASHAYNAIPSGYFAEIYHFVLKLSKEISEAGILATCILIDGVAVWRGVVELEKKHINNLYTTMVLRALLHKMSKRINDKLSAIICSDVEQFVSIIPNLIDFVFKKEKSMGDVSAIFDLYTSVAIKNKKVGGGSVTLAFAKLYVTYPFLSELITKHIKIHLESFDFVRSKEEFLIIGTNDGKIHVFRNYKLLFSEKIFHGSITFISISPSTKCAVVISEEDELSKTIELKKSSLLNRTNVSSTMPVLSPPPNTHYTVEWTKSTIMVGFAPF